ncbi:MAG: DUF885 domain-containing protein [Planctomycetes bacterium]|nr:DUF885 domain-containing protein [Planctomycetota bacterium]
MKPSSRSWRVVLACVCAAMAAGSALGMQDDPAGEATEPLVRCPELIELLDEHVQWLAREDPIAASQRGDTRYNDRLRDESPSAYERRVRELGHRLRRLEALTSLDAHTFTEQDHVDAALLRLSLTMSLARAEFFPEQTPVDARWGPQIRLPQMHERLPFLERAHYVDYVVRLRAIPTLIDQTIEQMSLGVSAGRTPPGIVVAGTDEQCFALAGEEMVADATRSPFFTPMAELPVDDVLREEAAKAIAEEVLPAMRRLGEYLRDEYIPACRASIAASEGVDGLAAYELALRRHTTTDLSADEIHAIGLDEVARIRAEMIDLIARTDYPHKDRDTGDELLGGFIAYLRTDPRFYYSTSEELLAGYRDICKRMDAHLPGLFKTLPRLPYGVKEMSPLQAPSSPTAYYSGGSLETGRAGFFTANTYRLDQRPKYEMVALALHEAVPGHHLQLALADEMEGVHEFRRRLGFTAYVEGWALYAERLGLETGPGERGMYEEPYSDFGRLTYEMWRACRLVVDTGIHAKGWSRQRAVDFLLANTALSETNVNAEIDRYIGWPGQACAYKIGELRIRELRASAEEALGERFDLRAFHEVVLGQGALPLDLLETRVREWIASPADDEDH